MLPETHPLIEAVTEPLADNAERRMAAHAFLEEKFDAQHPGVAEATARLEAAGRRKFTTLRKALPWFLATLAFAAAVSSFAPTLRYIAMMQSYTFLEPWEKPTLPAGLTDEQRLLLGDPELDDLEQKRLLHLHAPENPAYYAEYAQVYLSENGTYPPDFVETSARIAPENAFFPYLAARKAGKESFTKKSSSAPTPPQRMVDGVRLRPLPREMEFDITDPAAFEIALELIEKAADLPSFKTYTNPMIAARVRLLPTETMAEFIHSYNYAYASNAWIIHLRNAADLMNAHAEQLSKSGRKEEFIALAGQREAFLSHLGKNPDMILVGELIHAVIASTTAKNFEAAADRLGLTELEESYRKQGEAFQQERDVRDIRDKKEGDPFPEDKASTIARLTLPMVARQVKNPTPISDAEFEPMRMAEHELLGGLGVLFLSMVIALGALMVFLFRFVAIPMVRLPAKRMAGVVGMADWVWVRTLGVVLPIVSFLIFPCLFPV